MQYLPMVIDDRFAPDVQLEDPRSTAVSADWWLRILSVNPSRGKSMEV